MIGGIFADQIFWPYFVERPLFYQYRLEQTPINVTERKEVYIQENTALTDAIEKVEKAILGVKTLTKAGKTLEGSGLILTADGLAVTLAELVPQGSDFSFFAEGEKVHFQVLQRDSEKNLALIKLEKNNLATVGFANLDKVKLGKRVFLVGTTFKENEIYNLVNEGIISKFDSEIIETNIFDKTELSGSPLFDIEGNVLGLNTINKDGKVITIPISTIRAFSGL